MSLDTRDKRSSALGFGLAFRVVFPDPDGTVHQLDRAQVTFSYRALAILGQVTAGLPYRAKPLRIAHTALGTDFRWTEFWRNMIFALPLWEGQLSPWDLSAKLYPNTHQSGVTWSVGETGPRLAFDGTTSRLSWAASHNWLKNGDMSCLMVITPTRTGVTETLIKLEPSHNTDTVFSLRLEAPTGRLRYMHEEGGVDQVVNIDSYYSAGERLVLAVSRNNSAQTLRVFKNGNFISTHNTTSGGPNGAADPQITMGRSLVDTFPFQGTIECAYIAAEAWSDTFIHHLSRDPWAPLRFFDRVEDILDFGGDVFVPWHLFFSKDP